MFKQNVSYGEYFVEADTKPDKQWQFSWRFTSERPYAIITTSAFVYGNRLSTASTCK